MSASRPAGVTRMALAARFIRSITPLRLSASRWRNAVWKDDHWKNAHISGMEGAHPFREISLSMKANRECWRSVSLVIGGHVALPAVD